MFWLVNLYWIGYVTVPGYVLLCLSLGLYRPIQAFCIQQCTKKGRPLFLTIPILFVGAEAFQGIIYTGFNWHLLAHSQYATGPIIQIADIFGAAGVTLLIAMVNGLVADLVIAASKKRLLQKATIARAAFVAIVLIATILYGNWRLKQTDRFTRQTPLVGSVQPNVPSHIKELSEAGPDILDDLLNQSDSCFHAGAKFIAWPETMVLTTMNQDYLAVCIPDSPPVKYHKTISEYAKNKGYILFGAHATKLIFDGFDYDIAEKFNSAFLYRPDGTQDASRYDKIHLVPFGEYIPYKDSAPWFYKLIVRLSPYDYEEIYDLAKGTEFTTFQVEDANREWHFGVSICYEDTDPKICRKMVLGADGSKKIDWLVNISNDGWYVRYKNGKVLPSVELAQRTAITAFRAVENRISILRSVNTGISCIVDSTGRIRNGFTEGDLPKIAMDRQGVSGWFVDKINADSRTTFFSRHGQWLNFCGAVGFIIVIALALRYKIRKPRVHKKRGSEK